MSFLYTFTGRALRQALLRNKLNKAGDVIFFITKKEGRLFALDIEGYSHMKAQSIYEKFISNPAHMEIGGQIITINLKKKRNLPMVLENMSQFKEQKILWFNNK